MDKSFSSIPSLSWANSLYFFGEAGINIKVMNGFFDIINISSSEKTRIKTKYAQSFLSSVKKRCIFYIAPAYSKGQLSSDKSIIYALDIEDKTFEKVLIDIPHEFNSLFLSDDEEHLILISRNGKVFRIETANLEVENIMSLDDLKLDGCYAYHGAFYLPGQWQRTGCDTFEYVVNKNENSFFRLAINTKTKAVDVIPFNVSDEFLKHYDTIGPWCYNISDRIWGYCGSGYNNFESSDDIRKIRCEFYRSDKMLFHVTINTRIRHMVRLYSMDSGHILIHCSTDSFLHLIDLKTQKIKSLEIPDKEIMEVFVNEQEGYLIPTFLNGASKTVYFIKDFSEV